MKFSTIRTKRIIVHQNLPGASTFLRTETELFEHILLLQHKATGFGHKFNNLDRPLPIQIIYT